MYTLHKIALKFKIALYQVGIECLSRRYWLSLATKQILARIALNTLENKQRNY